MPTSQNANLPDTLQYEYPMSYDEKVSIDIDHADPFRSASETQYEYGLYVPTLARIRLARQVFEVLDIRKNDVFNSPLLLVNRQFTNNINRNFKGIWTEKPVLLGKNHHSNRFDYEEYVSRNHAVLAYSDRRLIVANLKPTNGTTLSADFGGDLSNHNIHWDYTEKAQDSMQGRNDFGGADEVSPYGYYKNHPIIGRKSSSVKNGVYLGVREALVVDDRSREIQDSMIELMDLASQYFNSDSTVTTDSILHFVNNYTRSKMTYNKPEVDKLSRSKHQKYDPIYLSEILSKGIGVCRHQCLLAALCIETLLEGGILPYGKRVGVERNRDLQVNAGHAWTIFETQDGTEYIIDPAQNFVGTKQQARTSGRWKYDSPA